MIRMKIDFVSGFLSMVRWEMREYVLYVKCSLIGWDPSHVPRDIISKSVRIVSDWQLQLIETISFAHWVKNDPTDDLVIAVFRKYISNQITSTSYTSHQQIWTLLWRDNAFGVVNQDAWGIIRNGHVSGWESP